MFVCSAKLSETFATSPKYTTAFPTILIGNRLNSSSNVGLEFIRTLYSRLPILAVPAGRITFEAWRAFTTSAGDKPLEARAVGSISIMICRDFPPNGAGVDRPGIVNNLNLMKFSPKSNTFSSESVSLETVN